MATGPTSFPGSDGRLTYPNPFAEAPADVTVNGASVSWSLKGNNQITLAANPGNGSTVTAFPTNKELISQEAQQNREFAFTAYPEHEWVGTQLRFRQNTGYWGQSVELAVGFADALASKASTTALLAHTANTANPHGVTKAQVGLGLVDNTSDANKPVSNPQRALIDGSRFNIKSYGAVGDYTTNDTDAINRAIAALNAKGYGALFIPAGLYRVTGPLTTISVGGYVSLGMAIVGEGEKQSIIVDNGIALGLGLLNVSIRDHDSPLLIRDLSLRTTQMAKTVGLSVVGSPTFWYEPGFRVKIENVDATGSNGTGYSDPFAGSCFEYGILLENVPGLYMRGVSVSGVDGNTTTGMKTGITIRTTGANSFTQMHFHDVHVFAAATGWNCSGKIEGLLWRGCTVVSANYGWFVDCTGAGYIPPQFQITGGHAGYINDFAMVFKNVTSISVTDNLIYGNGAARSGSGVYIEGVPTRVQGGNALVAFNRINAASVGVQIVGGNSATRIFANDVPTGTPVVGTGFLDATSGALANS